MWLFDGDYSVVFPNADRKEDFLHECNDFLSPVKCEDVDRGSIILKVRGTLKALEAKKVEIQITGLKLDGFDRLFFYEEGKSISTLTRRVYLCFHECRKYLLEELLTLPNLKFQF